MWQVRLAPLRPKSPLAVAVEGTSRLDFVRETLCWYRQSEFRSLSVNDVPKESRRGLTSGSFLVTVKDWPTVLLLIPRAAISVAVLLLYTTTAYGTSMSTGQFASRDSAFFDATTGALTSFAAAVVLTNCAWAALRLVVVVAAWVGLWFIDRPLSCLRRSKRDEALAATSRYRFVDHHHQLGPRSVETPSPFGFEEKSFQLGHHSLPRLSYGSLPALGGGSVDWRTRRQRRLRAAILVCLGSTPLSTASSSFPSPYLKSPYVLGAGSPWSTLSGGKATRFGDPSGGGGEHEGPPRPRQGSNGNGRRQDVDQVNVMSSPPRKQGLWSKISPFVSPAATFHRSPMISFSRVSPSPPLGQASGVARHDRDRDGGLHEGGVAGDISESRLHRRVRSVPLEHNLDDQYLHFEEVPLSVRDDPPSSDPTRSEPEYPRRFSAAPSFPSPPILPIASTNRYPFPPNDTRPATDRLRLDIPDAPTRPHLASRFSAFSSKPSSTMGSTPAAALAPPPGLSRAPAGSSPPSTTTTTAGGAAGLEAQLAQVPIEHLRLSDKLLSELRRVESYDRKAAAAASNNAHHHHHSAKKGSISKSSIRIVGPARAMPLPPAHPPPRAPSPPPHPRIHSSAVPFPSGETALPTSSSNDDDAVDETSTSMSDPTLRYSQTSYVSQPDSVGGQSDMSTLRGGAVRTPDLSRSLATFAAAAANDDPSEIAAAGRGESEVRRLGGAETTTAAKASVDDGDRPLLPPFRLSSDPRADNLSLGPATPKLGGGGRGEGDDGRFDEVVVPAANETSS